MARVAIRATGLSKQYRLNLARHRSDTLGDQIARTVRSLWRSPSRREIKASEFWALKDICLEIQEGDIVGLIGRNGAGKSTLLKIISRITEPTEGRVEIFGRVGSLLEVGTGFHPELTGRENVYFNGAVLGMTKQEIDRNFDEIVAFAEVERFIDLPLKRYSSGMSVRLAFAIAAHLQTEILIVDEVLAVGDAEFQQKCLRKIDSVGKEGRTVFFVSHNPAVIERSCSRAILLVSGRLVDSGPPDEILARYANTASARLGEVVWDDPRSAPGTDRARLHAIRVVSAGGPTVDVKIENDVELQVDFWNFRSESNISVSIHLVHATGVVVLCTGTEGALLEGGHFRATCAIPGNFLNDGGYSITVFLLLDGTDVQARVESAVSFTVHESGTTRSHYLGKIIGVVRPRLAWESRKVAELERSEVAR
jgi:lipopolysaccharide transport system ATP-binding protein